MGDNVTQSHSGRLIADSERICPVSLAPGLSFLPLPPNAKPKKMLDTLRNFTERLHREFTSRVPRSKAARAAKRRVQREVDAEFIFPPIPEKMLAGAKRFKNGATPYRDRRLPLFYVVDNHPKRPEELHGLGRNFIYAWKSRDWEFVDTFRRIAARDWEIQMGPNDSMDEHGKRRLRPCYDTVNLGRRSPLVPTG